MSSRDFTESEYQDALEYAIEQAECQAEPSAALKAAIGSAKQELGQGHESLSTAQRDVIHRELGHWIRRYSERLDRQHYKDLLDRDTPP